MNLVYLVGPPGVGKSTLMEALTARCDRQPETKPFAHDWLYRDTTPVAVELGRRREKFSGTDALSMSVQPKAIAWIGQRRTRLVLGEGARLGTRGFLYAARDAGYRLTLVHLTASSDLLDARRKGRGSTQSPGWMRAAATRAANLTAQLAYDATVHEVDATAPLDALVAELLEREPALEDLHA